MLSPSFDVKDYDSATFAMTVEGTLYQHDESHRNYAVELIAGKTPRHTVIIPSTVSLHNWFDIEWAWSDREQDLVPVPVWWTRISVRAFPDVAPEHEHAVRLIGDKNRVVRVPVIRPLTLEDFSDNIR